MKRTVPIVFTILAVSGIAFTQAPNQVAADEQAIAKTLAAYVDAYNKMDLMGVQAIWNPMPQAITDATAFQFKSALAIKLQLQPVGRPKVNGNSATWDCTRTLAFTPKGGPQPISATDRVQVTFGRVDARWVIHAVRTLFPGPSVPASPPQ